jgi:hypothetical protein
MTTKHPADILRALIEWDARWPKNQTYNATGYDRCHVELDNIIKDARTAVETTGELERLRRLQDAADALDNAIAEFGLEPQHISETYQKFHDALHASESPAKAICPHPVDKLFYHGFVSGNIGDFRCDQCNTVINRCDLDPRAVAAIRAEKTEAFDQ